MDPETIKKNEEILKKKKAALEAEKKAKEKEAADKAPAGKGKKDAKKGKKKWFVPNHIDIQYLLTTSQIRVSYGIIFRDQIFQFMLFILSYSLIGITGQGFSFFKRLGIVDWMNYWLSPLLLDFNWKFVHCWAFGAFYEITCSFGEKHFSVAFKAANDTMGWNALVWYLTNITVEFSGCSWDWLRSLAVKAWD